MGLIDRAGQLTDDDPDAFAEPVLGRAYAATLYTSVQHVARSGLPGESKPYVMQNGEPRWIGSLVAKAVGMRLGKHEGVIIGGCGMDMGFALVSDLSATLYPEGFGCI